jgi:hypothetical protein
MGKTMNDVISTALACVAAAYLTDRDNRRLAERRATERRAAVMEALRRASQNNGSTVRPASPRTPYLGGQAGRTASGPARGGGHTGRSGLVEAHSDLFTTENERESP